MSDNDLALSALLEYLNACEEGIAAAKQLLKEAKINKDPKPSYDTSKIKYFGIAPLPHFEGSSTSAVFGGWCLMISKHSQRYEEAMTGIIVVTHSDFGAYLIEASEHVVGQKENVASVSINARMSIEDIKSSVKKITDDMLSRCGEIIYFVDIPGGTPMNVVLPFAKEISRSAVICGVNMSMLIVALNLKDVVEFNALVEKVIMDGKKSICEVKSILSNKI